MAFLGGFAFDAATLRRPDQPLDLALLGAYLLLLMGVVVLEQRLALGRPAPASLRARAAWVHTAAQFLLGALLSATVVLYARSGGLDRTLGFVAGLLGLMLLVEYAEARLRAEVPRVLLFALAAFFYALLVVPIVRQDLGSRLHLLGGAGMAAGALALVVTALVHADGPVTELRRRVRRMGLAWSGVLAVLAALELTRVLPPVPLAVVEAAVVRDIRSAGGEVTLRYAEPPWTAPWRRDERTMLWQQGAPVWLFTAVFAPTGLETGIVHVWERGAPDGWLETDRIPYPMRGGRDGGYRGYTRKQHLQAGRWRVRVETTGGRELLRVPFELVEGPTPALTERRVR